MKSKIDLFVITRIKERRMQKNISQRGLAAILDCSPSFIGQVESEKFDVKYSVHQVFLVAQFFECSPAEFFPPIDFDS
ncbi:helix-turn-helix domain-containing protein [Prevotella melaninogenica]|uniref:helix-turn-helix domain-containing protein n=1 Tax=Prevotella melaninogenica TaxID=28132 RepID=UPI001C5D10A1|nr:helix-turn-helix transcriptional regulator [Prevotella melaninogenica]MBW4901675.1 helix-turn-helix transcriptional regulator [Prevotella melaninogenica]